MRCGIEDLERVKAVIFHPRVFPWFAEGHQNPDAECEKTLASMLRNPLAYVLMPNEFTVVEFLPQNHNCFDGHLAIMPEGRGSLAVSAVRNAIGWMFQFTSAQKIITQTPEFHKPAKWLAGYLGMVREGVNRKSVFKFGKLHDRIIFGITKEEWPWEL